MFDFIDSWFMVACGLFVFSSLNHNFTRRQFTSIDRLSTTTVFSFMITAQSRNLYALVAPPPHYEINIKTGRNHRLIFLVELLAKRRPDVGVSFKWYWNKWGYFTNHRQLQNSQGIYVKCVVEKKYAIKFCLRYSFFNEIQVRSPVQTSAIQWKV